MARYPYEYHGVPQLETFLFYAVCLDCYNIASWSVFNDRSKIRSVSITEHECLSSPLTTQQSLNR